MRGFGILIGYLIELFIPIKEAEDGLKYLCFSQFIPDETCAEREFNNVRTNMKREFFFIDL